MQFRHDENSAFVHIFYYNVTAISSPRCIRSSRQRINHTRRPPALSYRDERHENSTRYSKEKQNQYENATRYVRRLIYCLASVRQRKGRFPGLNMDIEQAGLILTLNMATNLYIVGS